MNYLHILKPGDKVGIIAPGSLFNRDRFDQGIKYLKSLGLKPVIGPHVFAKDFIFSGTVDQRVKSLKTMLNRRDIKALWCVRGGAGAYAVAEALATMKRPEYPKIVLGMSDVTALHLLFMNKWKWPVLHSPLFDRLAVSPKREKEVLEHTLFDRHFKLSVTEGLKALGAKKMAAGVLTGGNLALLAASLGSRWEVETKNKILFIEDTGERAYRIDRMLTQLKSAGKFKGLKGIVIGDFTDCKELHGKEFWPLVMKRHFGKLKIPVVMGFPMGHGDLRLTLPMGVKVQISTLKKPFVRVIEGYAHA